MSSGLSVKNSINIDEKICEMIYEVSNNANRLEVQCLRLQHDCKFMALEKEKSVGVYLDLDFYRNLQNDAELVNRSILKLKQDVLRVEHVVAEVALTSHLNNKMAQTTTILTNSISCLKEVQSKAEACWKTSMQLCKTQPNNIVSDCWY